MNMRPDVAESVNCQRRKFMHENCLLTQDEVSLFETIDRIIDSLLDYDSDNFQRDTFYFNLSRDLGEEICQNVERNDEKMRESVENGREFSLICEGITRFLCQFFSQLRAFSIACKRADNIMGFGRILSVCLAHSNLILVVKSAVYLASIWPLVFRVHNYYYYRPL